MSCIITEIRLLYVEPSFLLPYLYKPCTFFATLGVDVGYALHNTQYNCCSQVTQVGKERLTLQHQLGFEVKQSLNGIKQIEIYSFQDIQFD